jgi:protein-S-isoprenylcysteine O-methyltransferase Ste14
MPSHYWITVPWIAFGTYWAISALRTRATVRRESFVARYGVMLIEVVGFTLLFNGDFDIGPLGRHFVPRNVPAAAIGTALTWMGLGVAIWARYHLGQFWSGRITLKEDHRLIQTGPYARLRHPIYTGLDFAAIGTALVIDRWRCVAGVVVIMAGFVIKGKREEALLAGQFGEAFQEHRKHTGFLLPRL